ncbi:MAG TPA: TerC family protein [Acidiferrobacterales bacterium]|nr:TerC family protein [Acidiferrobacterales bacterium]
MVMFEWANDPQFWLGLLQIIWIDIILSGDNAVVIALACRRLPQHQQRVAILAGTGAAIALRVTMATVVTLLLEISYLKLIGSVLLLWIAIKLLAPQEEEGGDGASIGNLWQAIRTIVIADFVMSLDNVIGIAAAAKGSVLLLTLGLMISIPLIIFSSTVILRFMGRYPWIVTLGGALLGYIAGEMAVTDRAVTGWITDHAPLLHTVGPILGVVFVIAVGKVLAARAARPV